MGLQTSCKQGDNSKVWVRLGRSSPGSRKLPQGSPRAHRSPRSDNRSTWRSRWRKCLTHHHPLRVHPQPLKHPCARHRFPCESKSTEKAIWRYKIAHVSQLTTKAPSQKQTLPTRSSNSDPLTLWPTKPKICNISSRSPLIWVCWPKYHCCSYIVIKIPHTYIINSVLQTFTHIFIIEIHHLNIMHSFHDV